MADGGPDGMTVSFFQRRYPSANSVLLHGPRPVLVDTGFGADVPELVDWLHRHGTTPGSLSLVLNTHSHPDHAGGNHALQHGFGRRIAAEAGDAALINGRDPDACRAQSLRQPVEAYEVTRSLAEGDLVGTGTSLFRVVMTPGHTAGHISLHSADHGILILGDALHEADLGWLYPAREGADALERAADTIERLARLPAKIGYSGHGAPILDLPAALDRARRRLGSWREDPERMAWHACKRVFSHALMLTDGLPEADIGPMLLDCPWFHDYAAHPFSLSPVDFVPVLVAEMLRSGAAAWQAGRLVATAPHTLLRPGWPETPASPATWPRLDR